MSNDGGPAFPAETGCDGRAIQTGCGSFKEPGMTLRDHFAAKAMQGWMASYGGDSKHPCDPAHGDRAKVHASNIARDAYAIADAMLEARNAGTEVKP